MKYCYLFVFAMHDLFLCMECTCELYVHTTAYAYMCLDEYVSM